MAKVTREDSTREATSRIVTDDSFRGQFFLDKEELDPSFSYRFVVDKVMNEETNDIENALREGWQPVPLTEITKFKDVTGILSKIRGTKTEDGFVRAGNQILMKLPKKLADAYTRNVKEKTRVAEAAAANMNLKQTGGAPFSVYENKTNYTQEKTFSDNDE